MYCKKIEIYIYTYIPLKTTQKQHKDKIKMADQSTPKKKKPLCFKMKIYYKGDYYIIVVCQCEFAGETIYCDFWHTRVRKCKDFDYKRVIEGNYVKGKYKKMRGLKDGHIA